jgi:hypothetical protein
MDHEKLASFLLPWMTPDTWQTGHQLDEQRFHRALGQAFQTLGTPIYSEDFRKAMTINIKANKQAGNRYQKLIEEYAEKADAISEYLHTVGNEM